MRVTSPEPWAPQLVCRLVLLQQHRILTDVVLFDDTGHQVHLHSVVLSACSLWWQALFKEVSPACPILFLDKEICVRSVSVDCRIVLLFFMCILINGMPPQEQKHCLLCRIFLSQ